MSTSRTNLGIIIGAVLIAAGVLVLFGEVSGLAAFNLTWPLIIVLVGIFFFILMFFTREETGALAIPGSIITMIGLILLVQNAFNLWVTWAYAWSLIIVAAGIGIFIQGMYIDRPSLRRDGLRTIQAGLTLFVIFGLIFSLIFSYLGILPGGYSIFGLLMAIIGLFLLIQRSVLLIQGRARWEDRDLFWPIILMGVGLLFFLYGLGSLPVAQLTSLWPWWPLALIIAGLDWLVGRRWPLVGAFFAIIVVVGTLTLMFDPALLAALLP